MKHLNTDRALLIIMALVIVFLCYRQAAIDDIQDIRMEEWSSNTSATLEGMEYEMSRIMNADTTWKQ
jgi:hypothetical protein